MKIVIIILSPIIIYIINIIIIIYKTSVNIKRTKEGERENLL